MTPPRGRKRKLSDSSSLQVPEEPKRGRSVSPRPSSGFATLKNAIHALFGPQSPDPTNPVLNGASDATMPKPALGNLIRGLKSQSGRIGEDVSLLAGVIDTELFNGGYVDDRKYQVGSSFDPVPQHTNMPVDGADH